MASKYVRLAATKQTANLVTPDNLVIDMGAFRTVGIQRRALKTQAVVNTVVIQHNSTMDTDSWLDTAIGFKLDGSDPDFAELGSFSRYLRTKAPSQADGTAIFQFDFIGKE